MALFSRFGAGEKVAFSWRSLRGVVRTFSLSNAQVLVRGRLFTSEFVHSLAYPSRCELGAARPRIGAVVMVSSSEGHRIARIATDEQGIFRVRLRPGIYVLTALELGISRKVRVLRRDNPSFDLIGIMHR